jgi:phage shock protein B
METSATDAVLAVAVIFMLVIAPLWLILHYVARGKAARNGFDPAQLQRLQELQQATLNMQERIATLETILDAKVQDWRRQR